MGKRGYGSMGVQTASWRARSKAKAKAREERRWAKRNGPVSVSYVCPACGGPHSKADCSQR